MLRFAIDVREACRARKTGKGQWINGFVSELLKRNIECILFTDESLPQDWEDNKLEVIKLPKGFSWHLRVVKILKKRSDIDYYISPTSFIVPSILGTHVRTIPIIHDLIAFRCEPHDRRAKLIERLLLGRTLKNSSKIFTVSEQTKKDLLARFKFLEPKDVTSIFAGPLRAKPPLSEPDNRTILCVGTLCPRKNQLRLIHAFKKLPESLRTQWRLILAGGRGWNDGKILKAVHDTPGVKWKGHVADDEYEELLRKATVLALPSLYEGFGLQVLDALQRGIPLLLSDRGSLPEVAGEAAHYINPESISSISEGLETLLTSETQRESLRKLGIEQAQKFSWKRTVDFFLGAIH